MRWVRPQGSGGWLSGVCALVGCRWFVSCAPARAEHSSQIAIHSGVWISQDLVFIRGRCSLSPPYHDLTTELDQQHWECADGITIPSHEFIPYQKNRRVKKRMGDPLFMLQIWQYYMKEGECIDICIQYAFTQKCRLQLCQYSRPSLFSNQ